MTIDGHRYEQEIISLLQNNGFLVLPATGYEDRSLKVDFWIRLSKSPDLLPVQFSAAHNRRILILKAVMCGAKGIIPLFVPSWMFRDCSTVELVQYAISEIEEFRGHFPEDEILKKGKKSSLFSDEVFDKLQELREQLRQKEESQR
jgi:hypothetical protein